VNVQVKRAQMPLQPKQEVVSAGWLWQWLADNQKSKVWVAADIRQRLTDTLSGIGAQPAITVSRAGAPPLVTVELGLVHLIRMPGDLDPSSPTGRTEILKILNVLLAAEDYSAVLRRGDLPKLIPLVGSGQLSFRQLDISVLRNNGALSDLNLFEFPGQQADLESIGYAVSTEVESQEDSSFAAPYILNVARPVSQSPKTNPSAPQSNLRTASKPNQGAGSTAASAAFPTNPTPATAVGAQALPALQGRPVTPSNPGTPTPALSLSHMTYGAGVEYRPGQGARPLVSVSTGSMDSAFARTNIQATGGADNTQGVGSLDLHNDYIAFPRLHHQLSFDFGGKTDSTANRLLGSSSPLNMQRTGGHGALNYYAMRDWHGVSLQLFGSGARDNLVFGGSGASLPHITLWTADAGATIDLLREARLLPGRFELIPKGHFGWDLSSGKGPYRIWSLDVLGHQRVSDLKLISVDFAAHLRDASGGVPIYELPSLGGTDTLRGFREDDILARRFWSLQTELWLPVPGTLSALPAGSGLAAVKRFLQQSIRIALFVDAGGAYDTPQSIPAAYLAGAPAILADGIRWGPGAGIRFIRGNFALKLDWAYGQGRGQSGSGHGREYLGVVQNGAF